MKVLVSAASGYGSTGEIAEAIGEELAKAGLDVNVVPPAEVTDLHGYDAVVLDSAVYTGHWLEPAETSADRFGPALVTRPVWLFSSGSVGDPTRKLVQKMDVDPVDLPPILEATHAREHRMFAGKLHKTQMSFLQRAVLTVFRGMEGDFRDWQKIRAWASSIAEQLQPRARGASPAA